MVKSGRRLLGRRLLFVGTWIVVKGRRTCCVVIEK
jgi:hypothetical protein